MMTKEEKRRFLTVIPYWQPPKGQKPNTLQRLWGAKEKEETNVLKKIWGGGKKEKTSRWDWL